MSENEIRSCSFMVIKISDVHGSTKLINVFIVGHMSLKTLFNHTQKGKSTQMIELKSPLMYMSLIFCSSCIIISR